MYYRVIPFHKTFDTYGLIYSVAKNLEDTISPGKIVSIPLRTGSEFALCAEEVFLKNFKIDVTDIREIHSITSDFQFLTPKQIQLITFVSEYYITPIHNALGLYFPKNLLEKISKNTIEKIKIHSYSYRDTQIILSEKQQKIFENIIFLTQKNHLIYGVTGSGKTQIYIKIIQDNLKKQKQTLLLIPEIILTSQIGERVKQVFGEDVIILHSGVSAAKKAEYWMNIHLGNAKIIIGTRSSLFYPYNNLGSIIIDEEHDWSYVSDSAPRYHSIDVAHKLAELYNIPLILGSGTPKVTTFYNALQGNFELHQLLEKYSD